MPAEEFIRLELSQKEYRLLVYTLETAASSSIKTNRLTYARAVFALAEKIKATYKASESSKAAAS